MTKGDRNGDRRPPGENSCSPCSWGRRTSEAKPGRIDLPGFAVGFWGSTLRSVGCHGGPGLGYHGPRNTKEEEEETMAHYVTGASIKALRERKADPKQLAEQILVSDKAVSKWETGKGLPDLCWSPWPRPWGLWWRNCCPGSTGPTPIGPGNLLRSQWYVCPVCGNVVYALGQEFSLLWGGAFRRRKREEAEGEHAITVEQVEMTITLPWDHPMSKGHFPLIRGLPDHGPVLLKRPIRSRRRRFASPSGTDNWRTATAMGWKKIS